MARGNAGLAGQQPRRRRNGIHRNHTHRHSMFLPPLPSGPRSRLRLHRPLRPRTRHRRRLLRVLRRKPPRRRGVLRQEPVPHATAHTAVFESVSHCEGGRSGVCDRGLSVVSIASIESRHAVQCVELYRGDYRRVVSGLLEGHLVRCLSGVVVPFGCCAGSTVFLFRLRINE